MTLKELNEIKLATQDWQTDKGTIHNYIDGYYEQAFSDRQTKIKLLEIGLSSGDSLRLWKEWFINSEVYGIEYNPVHLKPFRPEEEINLTIADGYSDRTIQSYQNEYFDIIIDDGPHTLESMIVCVTKWIDKLKSGGKLVIEDVQEMEWCDTLIEHLDKAHSHKVYDMRLDKGRYDDIILEIIKK